MHNSGISSKIKTAIKTGGFIACMLVPSMAMALTAAVSGVTLISGCTDTSACNCALHNNTGYCCPTGAYKCPDSSYTLNSSTKKCTRSSSTVTSSDSYGNYKLTYNTPCDATACLAWSSTATGSGSLSGTACYACGLGPIGPEVQ